MKTIHIKDEVHLELKIKSIHNNQSLEELTNEILSSHLNPPTTSKEK